MTFLRDVFIQSKNDNNDFIKFNSLEGWVDAIEVGEIEKTLLGSDYTMFYNPDLDLSAYKVCNYSVED
jgi:hypothetical protein